MPTRRDLKAPCPQRVVKPHEHKVRELVASHPEIYRNGFWRAVGALAAELDYEIRLGGFLPDAYQIDRENCAIIMHEVVATCDLSDNKLSRMGRFWMDWDDEGDTDWLPRLIVHRIGYQSDPQEIDLCRVLHDYSLAAA